MVGHRVIIKVIRNVTTQTGYYYELTKSFEHVIDVDDKLYIDYLNYELIKLYNVITSVSDKPSYIHATIELVTGFDDEYQSLSYTEDDINDIVNGNNNVFTISFLNQFINNAKQKEQNYV